MINNDFCTRGRFLAITALALAMIACSPSDAVTATPSTAAQPAVAAEAAGSTHRGAPTTEARQQVSKAMSMAARMGGGMHVMSLQCGDSSESELHALKDEQRAAYIEAGGDTAGFEAAFETGADSARKKIANASAGQVEQGCREMRELKAMSEQYSAG